VMRTAERCRASRRDREPVPRPRLTGQPRVAGESPSLRKLPKSVSVSEIASSQTTG